MKTAKRTRAVGLPHRATQETIVGSDQAKSCTAGGGCFLGLDLLGTKWLAILLTLVGGLLGLTVLLVKKLPNNGLRDRVMSLSSCFAGGIFLGAGLLHMLADAVQSLQNFSYPVAELACALGYVMVLTIDAVIMPTLSRHLVARAAVRSRASLGDMAVGSLVAGLPTGMNGQLSGGSVGRTDSDEALISMQREATPALEEQRQNVLAITMFVGLAVHSLTEGFALGIQTQLSALGATLLAIVGHKSVAAFALGSGFIRTKTFTRHQVAGILVVFAFISPIAAIIGLSATRNLDPTVVGMLNGLAGGTFIFLAMKEVEHELHGNVLTKWFWYMAGFGVMAVAALYA
mmetsp:Transcript_12837/g.46917  ORF Transcript_12837/g.46917 Transcript_12837/m.46917 type:complete len:345 (-) Transcript_12837:670-1704(-)